MAWERIEIRMEYRRNNRKVEGRGGVCARGYY